MAEMAEILEIMMIVCFGFSWPMNVIKSWKARTAKGKSILFLVFILVGYVAGITGKFINPDFDFVSKWYVLFFYFLNFFMVLADLLLYFRNKKLDAQRENSNV
jgi:hypothetical protein